MQLCRKLAPLLTAIVGALALMIPTPDSSVAELSPLPPVVLVASADPASNDDAPMIAVREQASAALLRLQTATKL